MNFIEMIYCNALRRKTHHFEICPKFCLFIFNLKMVILFILKLPKKEFPPGLPHTPLCFPFTLVLEHRLATPPRQNNHHKTA